MQKHKPLRVITQDFELLTEVDQYESLQVTRSWHSVGELELHINRYMNGASLLQRGVLLIVGSDLHKVYIIKSKEIELDDNGKASENWTIKALALKSVLGQRITLPPNHTAYDNKQAEAETVMKHYINNNAVNPDNTDRAIPNLTLADDQQRGDTLSWQSRFKNLAEELEEQSFLSSLGWNISLDLEQHEWVFDISEGRDLTVNQSDNPPVIFSPEFDSLETLNYSESELDYKNTAYVAGPGQGAERHVANVGSSTGVERHELFVDARNVEETDDDDNAIPESEIMNELESKGDQELSEREPERFLEGQILTKSPFIYEQDYDLGDVVTVQSKDWGVTMDARITELKEIYEADGLQIEAVFNKDRPTLIDKIKRGFKQLDNELTK